MAGMMNAAVIREPGGPEVLKIEHMWLPAAKQGWVLIQIRAFGLNWSEFSPGRVCHRMSNFRAFSASGRSGLWRTRPGRPKYNWSRRSRCGKRWAPRRRCCRPHGGLRLQNGERRLIRGGTTSAELAATVTAKAHGAVVGSTLRGADCADLPRTAGADRVEIRFMNNNRRCV